MDSVLKAAIKDYLGPRVTLIGFAPVDRFEGVPEHHHPANTCYDAKTVIVFAIAVPRGMLLSPDYNLYALHRTYHSVYALLDEIGLALSNFIESQNGHLAVPIPSFAPLVYHRREPWGIISLKHAAVRAGLGAFGRNGLVHNPQYGTLLRLGAIVTNAEMEGDPLVEKDPCPPGCQLCIKACPAKAIDEYGDFQKMVCLGATIKHAIYPMALKDEKGLRNIERVINTAGYNYWLTCDECLKVCPSNNPKKWKINAGAAGNQHRQ
jgi:epoxyqueuosine reductase QueG